MPINRIKAEVTVTVEMDVDARLPDAAVDKFEAGLEMAATLKDADDDDFAVVSCEITDHRIVDTTWMDRD